MAVLPNKFDPSTIPEDDRSFEPIPQGLYKMQVIESRLQDTKSGSGQMLVLTLEILEGQYQNRRVWDQLNIINESAQAQTIAQQSLATLCKLLGLNNGISDSEELHFKPFTAQITVVQDRTGQYGPQNRVRYRIDRPAQKAASPSGGGPKVNPQTAAKPQAQGGSKPWNKPAQGKPLPNDEIPF